MIEGQRRRPPGDNHVHSEWSWDAPYTSMISACERAVALGLPSIAFTEHADFTARAIGQTEASEWQRPLVTDGVLTPPPFDVEGYAECLSRCRDRFPGISILSGVELGEPHLHARQVETLRRAEFDRVLVSLQTLPAVGAIRTTVDAAFADESAADVVRAYLHELCTLVASFHDFDALAHIDYAARYWPRESAKYRSADFEQEYRTVLYVLAAEGKALEVNTRCTPDLGILNWWKDSGGSAITFGRDAHRPEQVGCGFAEAAALAETAGFGTAGKCGMWHA